MEQLYAALIAAAITVIGALATYVANTLKNKDINKRIDSLQEFIASDDTEYYIECPNCKHKILLNKVKILVSRDK